MARQSMLVVTPNGESLVMEVAETDAERARGLMGRPNVPRGAGMYFRFPVADRHPFWMMNCLIPLDIAWLDENGVVVYVSEGTPPCAAAPCPTYTPPAPASQVIELGAGEARRLGIVRGARVLLERLPAGREQK